MPSQMIKNLIAVCVALAFAPSLFGTYNVYIWCGGGADNNWSTKANWEGGAVPDSWDYVQFPSGDWTVNLASNPKSTVGFKLLEGTGTVTLTGDGSRSITCVDHADSYLRVPAGRTLILDGVSILTVNGLRIGGNVYMKNGDITFRKQSNSKIIDGNAKLHIINGFFNQVGTSYLYVSNNAEVVIFDKGRYYAYGDIYRDNSKLVIAGGEYRVGYAYYTVHTYASAASVNFIGGSAVWMSADGSAAYITDSQFKRFAPPRGAAFIHPSPISSPVHLPVQVDFSGTLYVTNRGENAPGVSLAIANSSIGGGGTIYANKIYMDKTSATFDIDELYLGKKGTTTGVSKPAPSFVNGLTLGAFEDLNIFTNSGWTATISGPLAVKTENCFGEANEETGNTKRHRIRAEHLNLSAVTDISADGGGSVELTTLSSGNPEQLRSIEVAAGTSLAFTNCAAKLKTMNLKMGAGSRLLVDLSQGSYVDVAAVAELGDGAAIVVTALPVSLTSGKPYPIYAGPAKSGEDSAANVPAIEIPGGIPEGWHVEYKSGCAYLSDGTFASSKTKGVWTGAEDGYWTNTANWVSNSIPSEASTEISFINMSRSTITNSTATGGARSAGNFCIMPSAAPYVFRGDGFSFCYPYNPKTEWTSIYYSVRHDGAFPAIFDCDIDKSSRVVQLSIRMLVLGQGSVSMLGNTSVDIPLDFGGDVRIGGNVTASAIKCVRSYGSAKSARRSRLTVMPGASLTATSQDGEIYENAYFAVAAGGTMTVSGTQLLFTTNSNTHYVDGTLTINAPFGATKKQTFLGDGRLTLAGGFLTGDNIAGSIAVEGNMTLVSPSWNTTMPLSLKGNITMEADGNWTCSSDSDITLDAHSTLTFATRGNTMRYLPDLVSEGDVVVTGGGTLLLGTPGTTLYSLSCSEGSCIDFPDSVLDENLGEDGFSEVLALRNRGEGLSFANSLKVKERYDVYSNTYKYSVARKRGIVIILH